MHLWLMTWLAPQNLDKNIIGVHLMIHSKIVGIGVITGLCSMAALEPAVQPGDTLKLI